MKGGEYMATTKMKRRTEAVKIGKRLKALRTKKKLSQWEIARELDFSSATRWRQYELGIRIPEDDAKKTIAAYFGVSIQELFFD
jgi:transcriptional regulator with XRE-family HTH domain